MKIQVREVGRVRIMDLRGKLTLGDGDTELKKTVEELLDAGHKRIVVNLKNGPYIDTMGIGALIAAKKLAVKREGDVKLLMPSETVYRSLTSVSLHLEFGILDSEAKVARAFERHAASEAARWREYHP